MEPLYCSSCVVLPYLCSSIYALLNNAFAFPLLYNIYIDMSYLLSQMYIAIHSLLVCLMLQLALLLVVGMGICFDAMSLHFQLIH